MLVKLLNIYILNNSIILFIFTFHTPPLTSYNQLQAIINHFSLQTSSKPFSLPCHSSIAAYPCLISLQTSTTQPNSFIGQQWATKPLLNQTQFKSERQKTEPRDLFNLVSPCASRPPLIGRDPPCPFAQKDLHFSVQILEGVL